MNNPANMNARQCLRTLANICLDKTRTLWYYNTPLLHHCIHCIILCICGMVTAYAVVMTAAHYTGTLQLMLSVEQPAITYKK